MQRNKAAYPLAAGQVKGIKQRMLKWANQFSILCFLDSNGYRLGYNSYECLLAAGQADHIDANDHADPLRALQTLHDNVKDWLFGHLCYDLKNTLEPKLTSLHPERVGFPLLYFFVPQTVCHINTEQTVLTIESFDDPESIYEAIISTDIVSAKTAIPAIRFTSVTDKDSYLDTISKLRGHIAEGDCYEINYCNEGYCEHAQIEPLNVFERLTDLSPAPFAAYYKLHTKYMMCASPERYLKKAGDTIMSQPMKGTARREQDVAKDEAAKESLRNNIKEQAENVMIVDLVRNDLARSCVTGSVVVDELFGIYTFPQVHQMVSTVSGKLNVMTPFSDVIRRSFPMGSMTGAPKFKVMQLIEHYERSRRELYSGSVGYITPNGDFDLNVVIRSLFYNADNSYITYQTGGAITYDSKAEQEWEEMRLKAWAMERIFSA